MCMLLLQTSMILALFEASFVENSDILLAKRRAKTRLVLASSFVLATSADPQQGLTKAQCMALLQSMERHMHGKGESTGEQQWKIWESVFFFLDQDNSGMVEFTEFERLLLLCECCHKLSQDRMLAYKATIARADLIKADAHADLTKADYDLSCSQRKVLEETVVRQERNSAEANQKVESYLKELNQRFRIFGCLETVQLNNIAVVIDMSHFWVITLDTTVWAVVGFTFVYCFMVIIRIHSMQSFKLFFHDPRGREFQLQNKVSFVCSVVGMFGAILVILQECGVDTHQERLWKAIQLAPLLRIFVTNAPFRHIVRAFLTGLKKVRPFANLFFLVFYMFRSLFCMHEAYYHIYS